MYYERGVYPRGHTVPCKHCGYSSAEHALGEGEIEKPEIKQKGFRVSFLKCIGYEPKSIREWERAEKAYQHEQEGPRTPANQVISSRRYMYGTFILR